MALPIGSLTGTLRLAYFGWFDITGDVVRATTLLGGYTFGASETGDPDLDGKTFTYIPNELVEVGDASHSSGGASTLDVALSGLVGPNDTLLAALAVKGNWQGRIGRLWHALYSGTTITVIAGYYTGYMTSASLSGTPEDGSRIRLSLENYLVLISNPRARTYQDQAEHDPADVSAARIRASANGTTATAITAGTGTGGGAYNTGGLDNVNLY